MTNRNRQPLLFGFPSTWANKRNVSPFGYPFNVCQLHARCRYNFSGFYIFCPKSQSWMLDEETEGKKTILYDSAAVRA